MSSQSELLWFNYAKQIYKIANPNPNQSNAAFYINSAFQFVDYANDDVNVGNYQLYRDGNTIPALNSPQFAPSGSVDSGYQKYVNAIDTKGDPSPIAKAQLQAAQQALDTEQSHYLQVTKDALLKYVEIEKASKLAGVYVPPFDIWVVNNYPAYAAAGNSRDAASLKYYTALQNYYGQDFQAIEAMHKALDAALDPSKPAPGYNMPVNPTNPIEAENSSSDNNPVKNPVSSVLFYKPLYSIASSYKPTVDAWIQTYNILSYTPQYTFNISSKSFEQVNWSSLGISDTSSGGGGFVGIPFLCGISGSGWSTTKEQRTDIQVNTESDQFNVTISYAGIGVFDITPGSWFSYGTFSNYTQLRPGTDTHFFDGPNPSLLPIPYKVVVGFAPKIVLKVDQASYLQFQSTYHKEVVTKSGGGISIFGITIGGGSTSYESISSDYSKVAFDDEQTTVTIGPFESTIPYLLGILATKTPSINSEKVADVQNSLNFFVESLEPSHQERLASVVKHTVLPSHDKQKIGERVATFFSNVENKSNNLKSFGLAKARFQALVLPSLRAAWENKSSSGLAKQYHNLIAHHVAYLLHSKNFIDKNTLSLLTSHEDAHVLGYHIARSLGNVV
ncbi:1030_t:CDS:2 [Paraglomus occultum]|uniref:1030_t:CDS:1 n=1 Tax=Paraglomus occultum TaxID=144539 RepID=A0A9N9DFW3_9GLOM|nr:1030_t:CDS:2 [Paraglomus occultum]